MHLFLAVGAAFAFLGVALGAFGAHALKDKVGADKLAVFQTGVQYQMYHALALVGVGILAWVRGASASLTWAGWLFAVGIVLFSGSLYFLTGSGKRAVGAITPVGGLAFLAGWLLLIVSAVRA